MDRGYHTGYVGLYEVNPVLLPLHFINWFVSSETKWKNSRPCVVKMWVMWQKKWFVI